MQSSCKWFWNRESAEWLNINEPRWEIYLETDAYLNFHLFFLFVSSDPSSNFSVHIQHALPCCISSFSSNFCMFLRKCRCVKYYSASLKLIFHTFVCATVQADLTLLKSQNENAAGLLLQHKRLWLLFNRIFCLYRQYQPGMLSEQK